MGADIQGESEEKNGQDLGQSEELVPSGEGREQERDLPACQRYIRQQKDSERGQPRLEDPAIPRPGSEEQKKVELDLVDLINQ